MSSPQSGFAEYPLRYRPLENSSSLSQFSTTPASNLQGQDLTRRPSMQLFGNDVYTKALMNRIATGEATEAEHVAFNEHVYRMAGLPPNSAHQPAPASSSTPSPNGACQTASQVPKCEVPVAAKQSSTFQSVAMEDLEYQKQLMLLERENMEKLRQMSAEAPSKHKSHFSISAMDKRRSILMEKEKEELACSGFRGSGWELSPDPLLAKPASEYTHEEQLRFEQLWKMHMSKQAQMRYRKSKGLPPVHQVSEEALRFKQATRDNASKYTKPFCDFLTENPTVFHAVAAIKKQLNDGGFTELSERESWDVKKSGKYFVERNGSALIAFVVGANYEPGNGAAILAGHVDALTAKLKPISQVPNRAGYLQLGVAPYAGAPNNTWWDRDLGIGGRVLVKEGDKVVTKLVKLDWPIARIPTLAPHFGAAAVGPFNPETQMVPIIGLDSTDSHADDIQTAEPFSNPPLLNGNSGSVGSFVATQPPRLVKAIGDALGLKVDTYSNMVNWELELFDVQPATTGGLDREFIYAGRIDDKLCSWAAIQALLESQIYDTRHSSVIKVVGLFDDEEIGSGLRQGARSNFLPQTMERLVGSLAGHHPGSDLMGRTYASSFLVSSDVTHAVNPNFLGAYLENHAPHLNVGVAVSADSNGHMTTDAPSTAILKRCADKVGAKLQVFQIRNDSRSGGTVGPMLSSMTGIRAVDAGIPQLSMHSIRATTGALDPGLGVLMFIGFLNGYESADREFKE